MKSGRDNPCPVSPLRGALVMVALGAALLVGTAHAAEVALFVKDDVVNLRSGPGQRYSAVGTLHRGDEVRVQGQDGFWRKVYVPCTGATGWVAHWLLAEAPPDGRWREVKYVNGDDVQLRSGPGTRFPRVGLLDRGVRVDIIAYDGQWRKVRVPGSGEVGWIADWLLNGGSSGSPTSSGSSKYGQARYVAEDSLYLREGPGVEHSAMTLLDLGTIVYIMDGNEKWVKVHVHDGPIGWVYREYLSDTRPSTRGYASASAYGSPPLGGIPPALEPGAIPAPTEGWVAVPVLNIRSAPRVDSSLVGQATANEKFSILEQQEGWYHVRFASASIEGWIGSWLVGTPAAALVISGGEAAAAPAPGIPQPTETGSRIVQAALKYLGVPYRYAGNSPRGFDCSGLVNYVLREVGINVPRTSYDQWKVGTRITRDQLLPGDVVFFSNLSHVGIYIGNGNFVHAPYSGASVRIQSLADRARSYCGARRVY